MTALGDAIGKGQRRAQAGLIRVRRRRLDAQAAAELAVDAIEHGGRLPPQRQALGEIGAEAPLPGIALRGERREHQRRCRGTVAGRALDHVPEPRMQRQGREAPAVGRAAAVRIERAQRLQQRSRRGEPAIWGWRQEGQTVRRAHAPERQLEHQPGQIGLLDLRRVGGGEPARLRLGPEPVGVPRAEPAGPTGPLGGARPADADGLQPAHAGARAVAAAARQAGVDHHLDAFDGQAGLGDVGRQHDLAPARARQQRRVLLGLGKRAVELVHRHVGTGERAGQPLDLAGPRQEDQDIAHMPIERLADHIQRRGIWPMMQLYVVLAATGGDDRRIVQEGRDAGRFERRRHDQEAQIGAQRRLRLAHQC